MIICYNANQRMPEKTALIKLAGGGWAEALTLQNYLKIHIYCL